MSSAFHRPPRTAVQRAADRLREEILESGEGALLGSEDDLLQRLSVSRPTLRQTARLLEHEQVLSVRRGVNGGYYAKNPEVGAVAHVAASYLRMRGTTLRETLAGASPLLEESLRRAANADSGEARANFEAALAGFAGADEEPSARRVLRDEGEFMKHVLILAANPTVELFLRVLYEFGLGETDMLIFESRPDRIREWIQNRDRIAQAIVERDGELVVPLGRRRRESIEKWLDEDLGSQVDLEIGATRSARDTSA